MTEKQKHFKRFMTLVGEEMKEMIVSNEKGLRRTKTETNQDAMIELNKRSSHYEDSFSKLNQEFQKTEKVLKVFSDFKERLSQFNWCDICYDENKIKEFVQKQNEKIENQNQKVSEICKDDCLVKYHVFCGQLGDQFNEKVTMI